MMNLDELARWAYQAGQEAEVPAPLAIHAKFFSGDDQPAKERDPKTGIRLHKTRGQIIGGKPFSKPFLRYIDGEHKAMTPVRRALRKMQSPRGPQTMEFRICWAIVECAQFYEGIPALFRANEGYLRPFALRGLSLLYDLTQRERDLEPRREALKPKEELATVPSKGTRPPNGPRRGSTFQPRTAPKMGQPAA